MAVATADELRDRIISAVLRGIRRLLVVSGRYHTMAGSTKPSFTQLLLQGKLTLGHVARARMSSRACSIQDQGGGGASYRRLGVHTDICQTSELPNALIAAFMRIQDMIC